MLYETPRIEPDLAAELTTLDGLRARLGDEVGTQGRWMGTLRRQARAAAAASSTSIEGFNVEPAEALALVDGTPPAPSDQDQHAVAAYAHAMDHVGVMAEDPRFDWVGREILDLHFDACHFQRDKRPGLLREGPVRVTEDGGGTAYQGPDAERVPELMSEMVQWLSGGDLDAHVVVRAAMAQLHVVSVHPFEDGNGRISRIVQSLLLARERLVSPEFGSIEDYLADNTPAYYDVLGAVQGGTYQPDRDATPWVKFCVFAHVEQARMHLDWIERAGRRWEQLERIVADRGWPDRLTIALERGMFGEVDRSGYAAEAGVSLPTATGDLRRLADAGLLVSEGGGRSTRYSASKRLRADAGD